MPKTIQQFADEYDRLAKNIKEAKKEIEVIKSQAKNLFAKNQLKNTEYIYNFLAGRRNPNEREIKVWSSLNQAARRNFSEGNIDVFSNLKFGNLDDYVRRDGGVDNWWRGLFNGYKTFYDAWNSRDTFGINSHPEGRFKDGERERNTYMLGALYADNYIGSINNPFLNVAQMSGDGIANRAGTQFADSYYILKSGFENAKVLQNIADFPETIVSLNDPQEAKELQEKYKKNEALLKNLYQEQKDLEAEKKFLQPEKLELINRYKKISSAIDNLTLKVSNLEQNQKAQKNLTDSFFKGSGEGMSIRDELMSQSESLQNDISNLSIGFEKNKKSINSINKKVSGLGEKFADLKNLYSVNESKLKEDSQIIGNLLKTQEALSVHGDTLNGKISDVQKKMDENSRNYALEKEKIFGEIEELRKKGDDFIPAINDLNTKLVNLTKTHDLAKNNLLGKMKTLEEFNKTKFIEIENKNEDFKKRYDKDTGQLQRELGVVRDEVDARGRETSNLAGEVAQTREAFGNFEKQSNVKFKTLFDYNTYTNRQIKKQNTNKLTTLGNIRKAAQPDLLKKTFAGLIRGRFFDTQPILY
jgi:archaellum component FlaC